MRSGLRRAARGLRNSAPVPLGDQGGLWLLRGPSMTSLGGDAYLRAGAAVGTVWQIVHLLSSNVAKPEWKLFRKAPVDGRRRYTTSDQGSDQRVEVTKHAALDLLSRPNPFWSRFGLMETSQQHMELTGEWFWVLDYAGTSFPVQAWPVRPDRMTPVPDPVNFLAGWVYTSPADGEQIPLKNSEVLQGKFPNPMDPYRGLGPVQAVMVDIDSARYSAEWNRNFFLNSAEPGGVLQVDKSLSDDDFNRLTNKWREAHRGVSRAHRIAVLEGGVQFVATGQSMKDMDFSNLRNVSRDIIREAWGIHKIMLGNSDDVNRANAQTGEEVFSNWSVAPRLDRWRDAFNFQLLPLYGSTGQGVEFDYIYPLPQNREQDAMELTSKATAAQLLIDAGLDPHDVLEVVGLPDMGVAEKATQQPALPPGWVPGQQAAPDNAPAQDQEMAALVRRVLSDGYVPVETRRR